MLKRGGGLGQFTDLRGDLARKRGMVFLSGGGGVIPQCKLCCFTHEAVYFDREDSAKRTISGKILKDGVYGIAINSKYG